MPEKGKPMKFSRASRRKGKVKRSGAKREISTPRSANQQLAADLKRELVDYDVDGTNNDTVDNAADALILHVMRLLDEGVIIPKNFVLEVLRKSIEMHEALPNVAIIHRPPKGKVGGVYGGNLTVVGDLHGQYKDFANIIRDTTIGGFPSDTNRIVFIGDLVDRGDDSVGIMVVVLLMKLFYKDSVHIIRGNHEDSGMNRDYGFFAEVDRNYPLTESDLCTRAQMKAQFTKLFHALPICAVIEDQIFLTHGGIGEHASTMTIKEINQVNRFLDPYSGALYELLWQDPVDRPGLHCAGWFTRPGFGPDITKAFLARNNLQWMIRSHQDCDEGYKKQHEDLCWTVFSAPNYCGNYGNKGAVVRFLDPCSMAPTLVTIPHSLHYPMKAPAERCDLTDSDLD